VFSIPTHTPIPILPQSCIQSKQKPPTLRILEGFSNEQEPVGGLWMLYGEFSRMDSGSLH